MGTKTNQPMSPATYILLAVLAAAGAFWASLLWRRRELLQRLWREPVLAVPVLAIESDDWGPRPEDASALDALRDLLRRHRDCAGRPALMSLGVLLAHPLGGPEGLRRRLLEEPEAAPVRQAMLAGEREGVFAFQLHGMEHFHPEAVRRAAASTPAVRRWLEQPEPDPAQLPPPLQSRWVDASRLPSSPLPEAAVEAMVAEETQAFERALGRRSEVAVPPTFVWTEAVERAWAAHGITAIVTPGRRHESRDAQGRPGPGPRLLNGERSRSGPVYLVRDIYFEPERGHRPEETLQAILARWREGRPALVESHRSNYVGPAAAEHRRALGRLLELAGKLAQELARNHGEGLRFLAPAALAQAYARPPEGMFDPSPRRRLAALAARIRRVPELRRLLGPARIALPLLAVLERCAGVPPAPARA